MVGTRFFFSKAWGLGLDLLSSSTTSIHPLYAARAHQRRMPHAIREALSLAGKTMDEIDGIAFTRGPGMMHYFLSASLCPQKKKVCQEV
jgi:tRNA A37 threonylcarbamoyltransferase TsaD